MTQSLSALDLSLDLDALGVKKPVAVGSSHAMFSRYERKSIAKEFVRQLRATGKVVADPSINAYVQGLGQKLVQQSGANQNIRFLVIDDDSVNAFAALGGVIAVHTGMMLQARSEEELASVLAHEIAHISQHHIERAIEAGKSTSAVVSQALLLALAIVAGDKNPQVTQAAITAASGLQIQRAINYTRLHETEADAVGIQILSRAGYAAKSMEAMFESLSKSQRFSSSRLPSFLLTHPLTTARRARMHSLAEGLPRKGLKNQSDFKAVKQMVKLYSHRRQLASDLHSSAGKVVQALQLAQSGQLAKAHALVAKVLQRPDHTIYVKLLLGQYFAKTKQLARSVVWYKKAYQQNPSHTGAMLRLAEVLVRVGKLGQAKVVLDKAVSYGLPEARKAMAGYFARQGNVAESYYWRAEYAFLSGYTKRAIGHLLRAKRAGKPKFYLSTKIDARLKAYQRIDALSRDKS